MAVIRPCVTIVSVLLWSAFMFLVAFYAMRKAGFDQKKGMANGSASSASYAALLVALVLNILILAGAQMLFVFAGGHPSAFPGNHWDEGDLRFILLLFFVNLLLAWGLHMIVSRKFPQREGAMEGDPVSLTLLLFMSTILLVAALQEELVYRGIMLAELKQYGMGIALATSTLLFTAVHTITSTGTSHRLFAWLSGGIALFFIYATSQSLWVATLAHFSRNLLNILILVPQSGISPLKGRNIPDWGKTSYYLLLALLQIALSLYWYGFPA